jgi:hypothetical protein
MPTQYLSGPKTLTRERARYEVHMLADQLTPGGSLTDAFGRLRTSSPFTIFDSQYRYGDNGKWDTLTATNGSATHVTTENVMALAVTNESGSKVIRETRRVMPYQPGKSLLILASFCLGTLKANVRQRVGYFGNDDGIFLEADGETVSLKIRSRSLNTTLTAARTEWNGDKFDGTGYSGRTIDFSKAQIFWMDIEWLGVGDVRCGFVVDGHLIVAHTFHNDNVRTTTYMSTACLPIRYEIENLAATSGSTTMKQVCSSVISEGGYEPITKQWAATRTTAIASTSVANGYAPVVSLRLKSGYTDSIVLPSQVHILGTGNGIIYEYALIRNASITGGSWTTHTGSGSVLEYNISATSMTGGIVEESGLFESSNQSRQIINENLQYAFEQQLGRTIGGASDTFTLGVRHLSTGGGNVYGTLNWNSIL